MKKVQVALGERSYDIIIEKNILEQSAAYIKKVCNPRRILIVTDETVEKLYAETLQNALSGHGFMIKVVSFEPGEETKSLACLEKIYHEAFAFGMTRTDLAIALGGGVIGDLTGFFAATLFRGISFIQIPTTLLAQVDSSVGGKTGINVAEGKNLVGSFYQPKLVLIDPETLTTLSDRDFYDGMAEVIKYGCLCSESLFTLLLDLKGRSGVTTALEEIIYECCNIKRQLVEKDELDAGSRMLLNFGHTMGHVIEKVFRFTQYTHGQAVAIGMVLASKLGESRALTKVGTTESIITILNQYHLPTCVNLPAGWEETILLDKKMQNGKLNYVFLKGIGDSFVEEVETETLICDIKKIL